MLSALPGMIRLKNGYAQDDADSCGGCHKSCSTMGPFLECFTRTRNQILVSVFLSVKICTRWEEENTLTL